MLLGAVGSALDAAASHGRSALVYDRGAVEWSVSAGHSPGGLRLVLDLDGGWPARHDDRAFDRLSARLLLLLGIGEETRAQFRSTLAALAPPRGLERVATMRRWLGVVLARASLAMKVYVNARTGSPARRRSRVLAGMRAAGLSEAQGSLEEFVCAAGGWDGLRFVAVEVLSGGVGRIKVYVRPRSVGSLALHDVAGALGLPDAPAELAMLLDDADADGWNSCVLSAEFALRRPPGLKLDLNCRRLFSDDTAVEAAAHRLVRRLELPGDELTALRRALETTGATPRFTWLGVSSREGAPRVNLYSTSGRACSW